MGFVLDKLKEWDPKGAELLLRLGTSPWNSNVLPRKEVELISLALHCACTNLDETGTRRHIRAALDAGATRDEILWVLKAGAALATHSCSLGAPILLEEMKAAGINAAGGAKPETPACDEMRKMGQWNTAWDPFYELSPLWTEDLFRLRSTRYLQERHFQTEVHRADQHRLRRVHHAHVCARDAPAHQRRAQGWRDTGRDHGGPAYLRFDGHPSLCQGRAHSRRGTRKAVTMADFIEVARLDEVPPGQGTLVTVAGTDVALFNVDGTIYAMEDSCPHHAIPIGM